MNLRAVYDQVADQIKKMDFEKLWPGFKVYPFAIYDDRLVWLADSEEPKSEIFLGNTAIDYQGKKLAIWNLKESPIDDIGILTSKIIHEMFHAFQNDCQENRFPNEFQGLFYDYLPLNLSMKHQENRLLADLLQEFSEANFREFQNLRLNRKALFPKQYDYESRIEVIEGLAQFAETKALLAISETRIKAALSELKTRLLNKDRLLKIRKCSYDIGTALCFVLESGNRPFFHKIGSENRTILEIVGSDFEKSPVHIPLDRKIETMVRQSQTEKTAKIQEFIKGKIPSEGSFRVLGFDPLNSFGIGDLMYNPDFLMYEEGGIVQFSKGTSVLKISGDFLGKTLYLK
ncbi:MAG TPA: hypothetical protein DD618_00885 [Acholeplasmatales bacterium]|nr:hypothetical protein [Acholeplasmatales bacterium]